MRILFITANRLGDAVLSTGLLDHLAELHPQARFTVACGPVAAGLFERMPGLERLILVEKRRFDRHWLALWWQVVRGRWDLAVDLRGSGLTWLIPARRRLVMRGGRRPGHRTQHLASLAGLPEPRLPVAWWGEPEAARAASLLPQGPVWVALGPTANWSGKVWPAERFVALFRLLQRSLPQALPVILAGPGQAEHDLAAPVLAGLEGAVDLVGRLTLAEVAACLARCALFVGNDSGLMHLAAAAGTPTLGLFGPSRADEYAPAGRCAAFVVAPGPEGAAPMSGLAVEPVLQAALWLLIRAGTLSG